MKTQLNNLIEAGKRVNLNRQRGNVLILVVVVIVIMAILGGAYLQATRVQRRTIGETLKRDNIDQVAAAVVEQMSLALTIDLDGADADSEGYDGPWTNSSQNAFEATPLFRAAANVPGGHRDDMWLASTSPDFSGVAKWPHITNIAGYYVGNASGYSDLSSITTPGTSNEFLLGSTNGGDTNLTVADADPTSASSFLVDADGDGIGDSRWIWAPVPQIDGTMYVVAIRIIDASSLINANTALGLTDNGNLMTGTDSPRWDTPSELDFGFFASNLGATDSEIAKTATYRYGGSFPAAATRSDREAFWKDPGRYYGTPANGRLYLLQSEFALRYRNGLVGDSENRAQATIETSADGMNTFLRRDTDHTEYSYDETSDYDTHQKFFEDEPRKQMTFYNAAGVFAPSTHTLAGSSGIMAAFPDTSLDYAGGTYQAFEQVSLNPKSETGASADANLKDIAGRIEKIWDPDKSGYAGPIPTNTNIPAADYAQFATQFAVNIRDYADNDNYITEFNRDGNTRYGLESLPYITEVYTQARYKVTGETATLLDATQAVPTIEMSGSQQTGYAIEIRNPFRVSVDLGTVALFVNGSRVGLFLSNLSSVDYLNPDQVLILYRNVNDSTADDDEFLDELGVTAGPNVILANIGSELSWPNAGGTDGTTFQTTRDVKVELRATYEYATGTSAGLLAWPYSWCEAYRYPLKAKQSGAPEEATGIWAGLINSGEDYAQNSVLGNGGSYAPVEIMLVKPTSFGITENLPFEEAPTTVPSLSYDLDFDTDKDKLGDADKSSVGTNVAARTGLISSDSSRQIVIANGYGSPDSDIHQFGELAQVTWLAPTATQTVAEIWNATGRSLDDDFMLNFDSTGPAVASSSDTNANVPLAVILLDQFTTYHPRIDGVDNDGTDDIDDNTEVLIPGRINFNTAPVALLKRVLPLNGSITADDVANAIVAYRESPARRTSGDSTTKGIAYLSELLMTDGVSNSSLSKLHAWGSDGNDNLKNGSGPQVDFCGNPGNIGFADGVVDDREELMMLPRLLSQVGTVRSDTFIAYFLVRGYDANNFSKGPTASKRFVVLLRRSIVDGEVKIEKLLLDNRLDSME